MDCRRRGDLLWRLLEENSALREEYANRYGIHERHDVPLILYRARGTGIPRPVKHLANSGWDTIRRTAGAQYRWHDTRAAFCSNTLAAGADIRTVKELAGHESITTTDRYLKAADPLRKTAVEALAAYNPMKSGPEYLTELSYRGKARLKRKV